MKKVTALVAVFLGVLVLTVVARQALRHDEDTPRRRVIIAASTDPSSSLLFVAQSEDIFRREGLDVDLVMHTTGKAALTDMLQGKADFATIADTVLMFAGMDGRKIATIATIAESDRNHRIIALKEGGITRPIDLAGRRIGVTKRTSGEYFLYTFLLFQGIHPARVTKVNLAPEDMMAALESGTVDAVATWFPTAGKLVEAFGERAVSFEEHTYLMGWNLVAQREYIEQHPVTIQKLVRSLFRARVALLRNRETALATAARLSGSDLQLLKRNWSSYTFDVVLRETTLVNLEEQARWAMGIYYPHRETVPDFTGFFYPDGIQAVDPGAENVVTELKP